MIVNGKYDWRNNGINAKNFPVNGSGKQSFELTLVHFDKRMSSEAVLKEFDKMSMKPAKLEELLAFGSTYKEEQRKYPIVALGSVWRSSGGRRGVPCLSSCSDGRDLNLSWFVNVWHESYRFLAVSK
jgi:hypothetical protein